MVSRKIINSIALDWLYITVGHSINNNSNLTKQSTIPSSLKLCGRIHKYWLWHKFTIPVEFDPNTSNASCTSWSPVFTSGATPTFLLQKYSYLCPTFPTGAPTGFKVSDLELHWKKDEWIHHLKDERDGWHWSSKYIYTKPSFAKLCKIFLSLPYFPISPSLSGFPALRP